MKIKKQLLAALAALLMGNCANAALVDAVSVVVDNEPITIFEIYALSQQFNVSTKEALDFLIREKLEVAQIKAMNIQVDDFTLNQQLNALAAKNNMTLQSFYDAIASEGISANTYKNELRSKLQRDKLYQYIVSTRYQPIGDDEVKNYYDKNKKEFVRFQSFDVVKYSSRTPDDLLNIEFIQEPQNATELDPCFSSDWERAKLCDMTKFAANGTENSSANLSGNFTIRNLFAATAANITSDSDEKNASDNASDNVSEENSSLVDFAAHLNAENSSALFGNLMIKEPDFTRVLNPNIEAAEMSIESIGADPRVIAALTQTPEGNQTPILQSPEGFTRYLVKAKHNETIMDFEQVKNAISNKLANERENTILREYFETLKSRATITIIRLP